MPAPNFTCQASTNWRQLYRAAILELDPSKLPVRIEEASNALIVRARELFHEAGDNGEETENLSDAMYALRALRSTLRYHSASVSDNSRPNEKMA